MSNVFKCLWLKCLFVKTYFGCINFHEMDKNSPNLEKIVPAKISTFKLYNAYYLLEIASI